MTTIRPPAPFRRRRRGKTRVNPDTTHGRSRTRVMHMPRKHRKEARANPSAHNAPAVEASRRSTGQNETRETLPAQPVATSTGKCPPHTDWVQTKLRPMHQRRCTPTCTTFAKTAHMNKRHATRSDGASNNPKAPPAQRHPHAPKRATSAQCS